jgi:BirA family transcriptional regulator, biotin operon repressor / biotin---[acetyl-CoA-carboxylase] ligase
MSNLCPSTMTSQWAPLPLLSSHCDQLIVLETVGSTNVFLREHSAQNPGVVAVVANQQTAGRGRLSRTWVSKAGESLAVSVVVPLAKATGETALSWLPLVAGAILTAVLHKQGLESATLKWPNDVLVGQKKLAGILCEVLPHDRVIVGLGINIDFQPATPPSPRATALAHHLEVSTELVDKVLGQFLESLLRWVEKEPAEAQVAAKTAVGAVLGTLGRTVEVVEPTGDRWKGQATSLDVSGHLVVVPEGASEPRAVVASDVEHLYQ